MVALIRSANSSYSCYAYSWTASKTGMVVLEFEMRHDPGYWYLDDVSVSNMFGMELLINGGFESGSLMPGWRNSTEFDECKGSRVMASENYPSYSGSYHYQVGVMGCSIKISQSFYVTKDETYRIRFWLRSTGENGYGSSFVARIS